MWDLLKKRRKATRPTRFAEDLQKDPSAMNHNGSCKRRPSWRLRCAVRCLVLVRALFSALNYSVRQVAANPNENATDRDHRDTATTQAADSTSTGAGAAPPPESDQNEAKFEKCLASHYPNTREDFAYLLNCMGLTGHAVEIGVQRGVHAKQFLEKWQGKLLYLVDRWEHVVSQTYIDIANIASTGMQTLKQKALEALQPFGMHWRGGCSCVGVWKKR